MKPVDQMAVFIGTLAGAATAESLEQIVSAFVSAVAVYLVKSLFDWLRARLKKK